MSLARRGMRRIIVGGAPYYWRATGHDEGVCVTIVTEDAFVHGQRGQRIWLWVDYGGFLVPHEQSWSVLGQRAISPALVRRAIEIGLRRDPPFTGRPGQMDVGLTREEVREAIAESPAAHLERVLGVADALLKELENGSPGKPHEQFLGCFLELGRALGSHPELRETPAIADWLRARASRLQAVLTHLQAYVDAIEGTLRKEWPAWHCHWERCCERRSAVQFFTDHAAGAGLEQLGAGVDTRRLDARMAQPGPAEGRAAIKRRPRGIPASHGWWMIPSAAAEPAPRARS